MKQEGPGYWERLSKSVFVALPLAPVHKFRLRSFLFRYFAPLFAHTAAYQQWKHPQIATDGPTFAPGAVPADEEAVWPPYLFDPAFCVDRQPRWLAMRDELVSRHCEAALPIVDLHSVIGAMPEKCTAMQREAHLRQIEELHRLAAPPGFPEVTIVIPVLDNIDLTLCCLKSVYMWPSRFSFEVIVADDGSSDATHTLLGSTSSVRYLANPENLGFLPTCNRAAEQARGRYLVFLNNDTVVLPGWLDELVGTLEHAAGAGLVGSKLIFPDGRLQEAGGIVWRDGSGWNYGRGDDPRRPRFNYLRDVDYVSGASMAMPAELWRDLGGFDERYSPAYYEDTDLAFRVRERGLRVLYQPLSMLFHHEGATAGTSLASGVKRHQAVNQLKFEKRWRSALRSHGSPGHDHRAADRRSQRRALVIDSRTPMPDMDSGSIDCFEYLRILKRLGFHVTFIAENLAHAGRYTIDLQRRGVECLYHPHVSSLREAVAEASDKVDLVLIYREPVATQVIDVVRAWAPKAKIVFDTVDLHFLRARDEAELTGSQQLYKFADKLKERELRLMAESDMTILLGLHELELVRRLAPNVACRRIPVVREVPGLGERSWLERDTVMFIGGYEHPPNVDAAKYLVECVWPLVRERRLGAKLILAGSNMTEEIRSLAADDIVVVGFVPVLKTLLDQIRLTVAPLRYGGGMNGKVISSLCHGVPCVTTRVAVRGTELRPEVHVLASDDPAQFAESVCRVYLDRDLWHRLSDAGVEICRRLYSVEAVTVQFQEMLEDLGLEASEVASERALA